ncbi:protein of unknown function [Nitrospira japonica]|uniref:Uncharacterized protein n=1 Tax=Nitrospira japonica TaxID=1325564 RepID=A0A1W1IAB8_9BACT|nr:protein of unknown function [Nitrospira japonica]
MMKLSEHPALILHGILEAHPDLREGEEIDLDIIGLVVQCCEPEPPRRNTFDCAENGAFAGPVRT